MRTELYLFLVLRITPKSRGEGLCTVEDVLKPPSVASTDRFTNVRGNFGVILTLCYLENVFMSYFVFYC